jgi:hypothetical protein
MPHSPYLTLSNPAFATAKRGWGLTRSPAKQKISVFFQRRNCALAERECGKELGKRRKILLSYKKAM